MSSRGQGGPRAGAGDWSVVSSNEMGTKGPVSRAVRGGRSEAPLKVAEDHVGRGDQAASDADQTRRTRPGPLRHRGRARDRQSASDLDQSASDRDQAASDEELLEHPGQQESHRAHRAERAEGTGERTEGTRVRGRPAGSVRTPRTSAVSWRSKGTRAPGTAIVTAQERDSAADRRDKDSAKIERKMASRGPRCASPSRTPPRSEQAAKDRARAAEDRAQAAADRLRPPRNALPLSRS